MGSLGMTASQEAMWRQIALIVEYLRANVWGRLKDRVKNDGV